MCRFLISLIFLVCGVNSVSAQTLWDSLFEVNDLIGENKDDEAASLLNKIETQCLQSGNDSILAVFQARKGILLFRREKYSECIPYFLSAIDLHEKLHIKYQSYLDAFVAIGFAYGRLRDYDNAERYYRRALLRSVAVDFNEEFRPTVYKNLGNLYMEKGDSLLAQECFKRAKAVDTEGNDFMNHNRLEQKNAHWDELNNFLDAGQHQKAADKCAEMMRWFKTEEGESESYILVATTRANLLSRYLNLYDEAKPFYEEIIAWGKNRSETNENVCGAYCNLALYYSVSGNFAQADTVINEATPYLTKAKNEYYPPHSLYRFVGNGAYWKENYGMAVKYYEQYLNAQQSREPGTSYEDVVNQLSVSYLHTGNPVKAKSLLSGLLKTDETRLRADNAAVLANIYHNLGRATMLCGSKSEALKLLVKSELLQMKLYGEVSERTVQYIRECDAK